MSGPKTVVVFGSYAPSLIIFRGSLISAILGRGHKVIAVAPEMDSVTAERLKALGAEPYELRITNQSLNPLEMLSSYRDFRRFLRSRRPDVLINYTIKPVIVGALAGGAEGVPKIVSLITGAGYAFSGGKELKRRLIRIVARRLYRLALRRSDWVVFQNPDDEALFRKMRMVRDGQHVGRTAGSGVDLDQFDVAPLPEKASFLMISRLLKDKGILEFAAASRRLKEERPDVSIELVGYIDSSPDSITESDLQRMVADGIHYRGRLDDVRPALADCSVYVLPSCYREGTPRSLLEGMAMGRALITTDAPGCRETVRNDVNGLLIPRRDSDALYRAMMRFVDDPSLAPRMGRESRKFAEERFDVNQVNADIMRMAEL